MHADDIAVERTETFGVLARVPDPQSHSSVSPRIAVDGAACAAPDCRRIVYVSTGGDIKQAAQRMATERDDAVQRKRGFFRVVEMAEENPTKSRT
tara:strand:- start:322 stop:606 length:285 start_codon:yes stop_codon:yes gene_type:complete